MTNLDEQLRDLYGPQPAYSDYKRGEQITYRTGGKTFTGTIVWVAAPSTIAGRDIPTQYIVESDQHGGIPDVVMLGQIVIEREASTMAENQDQDASTLDTAARPFKAWLRARLRHAKRDAIDALAKRLLDDSGIPQSGSRSMYLARMRLYRYSAEDLQTLADAWREMFEEQESWS